MCGGYSVLKDIYKTEVYALARCGTTPTRADGLGPAGTTIPESSLVKAPTRNCGRTRRIRTRCRRTTSGPDAHDARRGERSVAEIAAQGFARETVARVQRMLFSAEYKRRQAPPGVKITGKSFGRDRRYPLTNAFRET